MSAPTRFTPPLSDDYPSLFDKFERVLEIVWTNAFGFTLDPWQRDLLRRVLEVYPDGHPRAGELRFRQAVISLARQNGKTELAAALGLIGLLRDRAGYIVGIASSREQAALVYKRTMQAIAANGSLAKRFKKLTDTRGIQSVTGAVYELKASKGAALQGLPVSTAIVDEVHLIKPDLWSALVAGTGARSNTLIVGITTAGDSDSQLLNDLYKAGDEAIAAGDDARMFFAVWEAPEARVPDDDTELLTYLEAANPALASGRLDPALVLADVRAMPDSDVIRYRLNRFTTSTGSFLPLDRWAACQRDADELFPMDNRPVFAIDRTPDWGYATVTVAAKDATGIVHTEVVASVVKPSLEQLVHVCVELQKHNPRAFVMDGYGLKELAKELQLRGLTTRVLTQGDVMSASSMFYGMVQREKVKHAGDPLMTVQVPRTVRKNIGESFRISRADSSTEIDAVLSTLGAVYAAETISDQKIQLF